MEHSFEQVAEGFFLVNVTFAARVGAYGMERKVVSRKSKIFPPQLDIIQRATFAFAA